MWQEVREQRGYRLTELSVCNLRDSDRSGLQRGTGLPHGGPTTSVEWLGARVKQLLGEQGNSRQPKLS